MSSPLLLIPFKADPERDAVATAWQARGWELLRLDRFWEPPALDPKRARIYGGTAFAHVLAQKLGLELVSPADELLLELDPCWTSRALRLTPLAGILDLNYPIFAKPLIPKLFDAAVFKDATALAAVSQGLENDTQLLVSEVVHFESEFRCWCLDGEVMTVGRYEGPATAPDPSNWVTEMLQAQQLHGPLVVDVGMIPAQGWAVVEFNACWGAGLNGASATGALACIEAATRSA